MKYLPRKIVQEEINKVNPAMTFSIILSKNLFHLFEHKSYVIKVRLTNWIYPLVINSEVIKIADIKGLREILKTGFKRAYKDFSKRFPVKPYNDIDLRLRYIDLKYRKKIKNIMDWELEELKAIEEFIKTN